MIAHLSLEHRPFFTVFRGSNEEWQIVDAHQDVYRQPTLTVRESLTRILCLSHPLPARIHSFVAFPQEIPPPTHFLDMTWKEISDTWTFVAVDLVGVWDRVGCIDCMDCNEETVSRLPTVEEGEAAKLLVNMASTPRGSTGMRLRSGKVLPGR